MDYTTALEINPKDVDAYIERGKAYGIKGDYKHVILDYTKAIEFRPEGADLYIERGYAYTQKGDYNRTISDYDKAMGIKDKAMETNKSSTKVRL